MRSQRWIVASVLLVGCRSAPQRARADGAVLRAAIADWQEGPTDGRVCLDARVLRPSTAGRATAVYWASGMLDSLLSDPLIAVDRSTLPIGDVARRYCVPSHKRARIALGRPERRGDSARVDMSAWIPASESDTAVVVESPVVLVRQAATWHITSHPAQHFQILERPR